ncbi:peptidoglycan-binding domain-containing protein [Thioclava atlantica]|uniref:Peptidoglycan-binding domain 1 protein n=1 Tax=Thioclava atlantica TaxID=1317124 RepID=A0A085U1S1_9RHOB|nr:peptidoglycan-binding domain-containing protein [Thioclava atlantica]KFE36918.1 peptidoglycan-binding domain 1 protein [Thioclava atlantica]
MADRGVRLFGTAGLVLAAALALAGCQPEPARGTPPQGARPAPERTLARVLVKTPPAQGTQGCYAELKAPATVETVTQQVQVVPEQRDPKTGEVTQPAIYREVDAQRIVEAGSARYFPAICSSDLTPAFVAMVQRALGARGLYSGAADGKLDPATGRAIAAYQKPRGLDSPTLSVRAAQELGLYIWTP